MPRYIFQIEGEPDSYEADLPDVATAKCEAVRYACRVICDEAESFWDQADFKLEVTDEQGLTLFTVVIAGWEAPAMRLMG